jgi:hypothetical protein
VERALRWLPAVVAVAVTGVAATGLLWRPPDDPVTFETARGRTVELAGGGLYHYDTVFAAAGNTAADAVVLLPAVPLMLIAWRRHRSGSPRGSVLLTGALGYLLYVSATYAFSVAYNPLYLAYVLLLSTSLFSFVAAFVTTDRMALAAVAADPALPHRSLSRFLFASAAVIAVVWLTPLLTAVVQGTAPRLLDSYTTMVTETLDLAVIAPSAAVAGVLVRRHHPLGHLLAAPLLVTVVLLLPSIALVLLLQAVPVEPTVPADSVAVDDRTARSRT